MPITSRLFQRLAIDFVGPLPPSTADNRYLLVCVDYYSHWVEAFPLPEMKSYNVVNVILRELVPRFGCPEELLSDRGSNFLSDLAYQLYYVLGTKKLTTTAYHPQTNGLCERMNGVLKRILTHFTALNTAEWETYLPWALMTLRTTPSQSLAGLSPFRVLYGQDPRFPLARLVIDFDTNPDATGDGYGNALHRKVDEERKTTQELLSNRRTIDQASMKSKVDRHRVPSKLQVGQFVYKNSPPSALGAPAFTELREGPFRIIKKKESTCTILNLHTNKEENVNESRLSAASYAAIPDISAFILNVDPSRRPQGIAIPRDRRVAAPRVYPLTTFMEGGAVRYQARAAASDKRYDEILSATRWILQFLEERAPFLRTPLSAVLSFVESLLSDIPFVNSKTKDERLVDARAAACNAKDTHDISLFQNMLGTWILRPLIYLPLVPVDELALPTVESN